MYPYILRIGDFSIPAYPFLYGTGIAVAGMTAMWLGKREGLDSCKLAHLTLIAAILILLGGRLMYVLVHSGEFQGQWETAFDLSEGGQVHYGGVLCAVIVGLYTIRKMRLPVHQVADVFAVGAPLGIAIGRIGCFCRGCCFGKHSDLPWSVQFPPFVDPDGNLVGSPAFLHDVQNFGLAKSASRSLPVHPSQLYESAISIVVFAVMLALWHSGRFRGRLLLVYMMIYCVVRFLIEFTRVNVMAFYGLTIYQVFSMAILVVAITTLVFLKRREEHRKKSGRDRHLLRESGSRGK